MSVTCDVWYQTGTPRSVVMYGTNRARLKLTAQLGCNREVEGRIQVKKHKTSKKFARRKMDATGRTVY